MFGHKLGAGGVIAGGASLDERCFANADVRPTNCARLFH
jgi:hypothetical protein